MLWSRTNCLASASRNVACPRRSGRRDNRRIVSSAVFLTVLRRACTAQARKPIICDGEADEQDQDAAERRSAGRRGGERRRLLYFGDVQRDPKPCSFSALEVGLEEVHITGLQNGIERNRRISQVIA